MPRLRTVCGAVALLAIVGSTPLAAQEEAAEAGEAEEAAVPHLPADSMELGARYVDWILDYRADSLWSVFSDGMKERFVSVAEFRDGMDQIHEQIGPQERVISRRFWMRNDKPQYWYTAKFMYVDEPVVFRTVIEPDGTISGIGVNPESQNPPVDDPDQHGDADG